MTLKKTEMKDNKKKCKEEFCKKESKKLCDRIFKKVIIKLHPTIKKYCHIFL